MIPAKQFDLCPWNKLVALPHMGWQHAGWFASYVVNAKNILEWGCGGSTLWMAMLTKGAILSVEHVSEWRDKVARILKQMSGTFTVDGWMCAEVTLFMPQVDEYVMSLAIERQALFDLIFIDGQERPACLAASYDLLAPGGVVFLHDSQRTEYEKAMDDLICQPGMQCIDERVDASWINPRAGMWAAQKS